MMCIIISLVKRLLIKLGWVKATRADADCPLTNNKAGQTQHKATADKPSFHTRTTN
ncbi:MAG: hypothetical protein HY662_04820 [Chloroflexi bacterium]|nr:hypothetical protein [Chloroflexota bacterium]